MANRIHARARAKLRTATPNSASVTSDITDAIAHIITYSQPNATADATTDAVAHITTRRGKGSLR